eukprot:TRINITY_DN23499_c0_g1_i1.p1 TRINITY_DN23499_c0_g1~~TRINITY_DN23499_c0_g1_i1.p1  ORF type:complete len:152 (+),score=32.15 TRINITY_DN23499_c0_g1_i1:64-519(+)
MADDHVSGSGASLTYPMQCSALRKGGYVNIRGFPCKIVNMSTSKTGKHGHAKVNMTALDIFTSKKYEDIVPSTHNVEVPNVTKAEYQLIDISDEGYMSLMLDDGTMKEDLKLPAGEVGEQIQAAFDDGKELMVATLSAMNKEQAMSFKEVK